MVISMGLAYEQYNYVMDRLTCNLPQGIIVSRVVHSGKVSRVRLFTQAHGKIELLTPRCHCLKGKRGAASCPSLPEVSMAQHRR